MSWTQKDLEELYRKVNERAMKDPEFKERVIKDTKAALEEVAGCELPEELGIKNIEKDSGYANTYVTPDFAQGEINMDELKNIGGGAGGYAQAGDNKNKQTNSNDFNIQLITILSGPIYENNICDALGGCDVDGWDRDCTIHSQLVCDTLYK